MRTKLNIRQAVILAGGLGKRLKKITKKTPKPLIKIGKKSFIDYIILNLKRFGIKRVLILTGYKSSFFYRKYHNKKIYNINIKCIKEKKLLGTGGAILNAKKKLDNVFFLCNGDTYFDFNINDLIQSTKNRTVLNMALTKNDLDNKRYTKISIKKNKIVKLDCKNKSSNLINTGFYVVRRKIIKFIDRKICSLEKDIFPKLLKKKILDFKIYDKEFNNFLDIGVPKDLQKAEKFIKKIKKKPGLFLDRDGVINKDLGYVYSKKNFIWRKGIIDYIKKFNDNNYYVFVISNQSGIGRGYYSEKNVKKLHNWINQTLISRGAHIDNFFYASYFKDSKFKKYRLNKNLRKPNIGMIKLAKKKWDIDIKKSILIGDSLTDKITAINAGIRYKILKFEKKIDY